MEMKVKQLEGMEMKMEEYAAMEMKMEEYATLESKPKQYKRNLDAMVLMAQKHVKVEKF